MQNRYGGLSIENSYLEALGSDFYSIHEPDFGDKAEILYLNKPLCDELELDKDFFSSDQGTEILLGRRALGKNKFFAQSYAGHQFGNFVKLGDGRALMLGEHLVGSTQKRVDLQWKGSGQTIYSRGGDGKAALGPMLREILISEYLKAIKIPTSRVLCLIGTGEKVFRAKPLNGAAIVRVAESHLRVGSFEYAAAFTPIESKTKFLNYAMQRHGVTRSDMLKKIETSDLARKPTIEKVRSFFEGVVKKQVQLLAKWMSCGFIHGVMNTDNMSISGESIDFGPCAFMNLYNPSEVFSSIDRHGRYAYVNQPSMVIWNLTRFAESILEFLGERETESIDYAQCILRKTSVDISDQIQEEFLKKLGLDAVFTQNSELQKNAIELKQVLLHIMQAHKLDFTNSFRALSEPASDFSEKLFSNVEFAAWYRQWKDFQILKLGKQIHEVEKNLILINPKYIPRNMVVQKILDRAEDSQDLAEFLNLLDILKSPFKNRENSLVANQLEAFSETEDDFVSFCGT